MKKEVEISPTLDNFTEDDFGIAFELFLLMFKIKKELCGVLGFSLLFKENMKK